MKLFALIFLQESLTNHNLAETCENIDSSMNSPMSPNPHPFNRTSTTVDQTVFAWSSDGSRTAVHQQQVFHQGHSQPPQPYSVRNLASAVARSDSRDSVHSTRSDSFCDRWGRQGVDGDGNKCIGDQPIDLSSRTRSQDPLSQYSVPVRNRNNTIFPPIFFGVHSCFRDVLVRLAYTTTAFPYYYLNYSCFEPFFESLNRIF